MKLLGSGINPHIGGAKIHVRVSRETQTRSVKQGRKGWIRNRHIQVFKPNDVSYVALASIIVCSNACSLAEYCLIAVFVKAHHHGLTDTDCGGA